MCPLCPFLCPLEDFETVNILLSKSISFSVGLALLTVFTPFGYLTRYMYLLDEYILSDFQYFF